MTEPTRTRRLWERLRNTLGPVAMLLGPLLGLAALVGFNRWWAMRYTQPGTFALAWAGLRAWLFHGHNPYDLAAVRPILASWLKGPLPPGTTATPFFAIWFYLPLALVPDGPTAYALWLTLQQFLVALWAAALVRMLTHRSWAWSLAMLLTMLWPATWYAWRTGSPTLFVVAAVGLAWTAFMQERDGLAGLLFLAVALDWSAFAWALVAWGMWALGRGRRDGPLTWGMLFVAGAVLAQWLQPRWWVSFLLAQQRLAAGLYPGLPALTVALTRTFPGLGLRVGLTLSGLVLLWMLVHWGRAWIGSPWTAYWTWHWTLAASAALSLRFAADLPLLLLPALFLTLTAWWHRWRYGRQAGLLVALALWGGGGWLYHTAPGTTFTNLALLVGIPFTLTLLAAVRWWFVRPEPWWTVELEWM